MCCGKLQGGAYSRYIRNHASFCPSDDGSIRRHNSVRDRIISEFSSVFTGLRPITRMGCPTGCWIGSSCISLDIYIDDMQFAHRPQGFDVTIKTPHSQPYARSCSAETKFALRRAEAEKETRFRTLWLHLKLIFSLWPLASMVLWDMVLNEDYFLSQSIVVSRGAVG